MGILTDHTIGLNNLRVVWKSKDKYTNKTIKSRSYKVNVNTGH